MFLALYKMVSLSAPRIMASSNNMAEKNIPILTKTYNTKMYRIKKVLLLFSYRVDKTFQWENAA